ncbi:hypothetical protein MA5S0421_5042 [Mycobacteroides abscessus 5S-0421]|nr:hypothetical protein MA5S0421_5042 [Mycobacteroides abscessus 5S-0421]
MPADDRGLALRRASYEQLVRVALSASGLGNPSNASFSTIDRYRRMQSTHGWP